MNNFIGNNPVVEKRGDQNQIVFWGKPNVGCINTLNS